MLKNILKKKKRRVFMKIRKYSNFKARIMKSNVKIDFMFIFNWYKGERVNGIKKNGCCHTSWTNIMFIRKDGNILKIFPLSLSHKCSVVLTRDKICVSKVEVDEETLSPEEQKERKIMKLLLKIKNGTPPMRKVGL